MELETWRAPYAHFIGASERAVPGGWTIVGAPFDSTTCFRPGARGGPRTIRYYSYNLEEYSVALGADLGESWFEDAGDLELPFGSARRALEAIERAADAIFERGTRPLLLGGEHSVSAGVARSIGRHHPDAALLHIDAHYDLRDDYEGEALSHATALRLCREAMEIGADEAGRARMAQIAVRSGPREEAEFAARWIPQYHPETVAGLEATLAELGERWAGRPVYVTFDIDGVDPAYAPGTGTPEAGGLSSRQALALMRALPRVFPDLVGLDLVEVNPSLDPSGITGALAALMVREFLIASRLARSGGRL